MPSRNPADVWSDLVADDDAIDEAASVTPAQAERELREAGYDVAAERAKASAFLERLSGGRERSRSGAATRDPRADAASSAAKGEADDGSRGAAWVAKIEPLPVRRRSRRRVILLAAALAAATAGGALYAAGHWSKKTDEPNPPPRESPTSSAAPTPGLSSSPPGERPPSQIKPSR